MATKLTPMQCKTEDQLATLKRDNVQVGDFSILVDCDNGVYLSEQPRGGDTIQKIVIPKSTFDKLTRWYTAGIVPKEDARSRKAKKKGQ